ncbi:hypothetical protein Tco_1550548 [Tanacetum coccineum]
MKTTWGDPAVRKLAFQCGGQGFESNKEKSNPFVVMEVHLHRLRAIQKGSRLRINVLTRYLEQMCGRDPEMLRVESLPDHPLIKYGFNTLERETYIDMTNSSNLVALLRRKK